MHSELLLLYSSFCSTTKVLLLSEFRKTISGFEFKQSLPVIKDNDLDLDRHLREFESLIDCHSFGKRGVRPYDLLTVFRRTLATGSTRLKIYDTELARARKRHRLPGEAKQVFDEIIAKLKRILRETGLERKERAERAFEDLTMGRLPHPAFRAEWEK